MILRERESDIEDEEEAYDGSRNHPGPFVRRPKHMKRPDWLAVGVAVLSIITTLGAWVWWGGRLSQRVDSIEAAQHRQEEQLSEFTRDNAKQDIAISVTNQQYTEVIRRLDGIDRKLDRR